MMAPTDNPPKALAISYWNLNRVDSGGLRRIKALLEALGRDCAVVQPSPAHPHYRTYAFALDLGRRKLGINWGMFNFCWPLNARKVHRAIEQEQPQCLVLTSIWAFIPLKRYQGRIPMVLDTHDVNAVAIAERFGTRHPFTRLVTSWERRCVQAMDHICTCSEQDARNLCAQYGLPPERVTTVPNGVDLARFGAGSNPGPLPEGLREWTAGGVTLLFMGKLDYQPNREALAFLRDRVLPELEQAAPHRFRFVVTGGPVPTEPFPAAFRFVGRLPEHQLLGCLAHADLCLAPIMTGSGTRLKILEYMAAEKPVLSTPKGAEGIDCRAGEHLWIAEPEDFARTILEASIHPDAAPAMAARARALVASRYDWDSVLKPIWREVLRKSVS
ncbi:MAG TPA: hypothetical protein DEW46_17450 [Verrucomicrobia bacterium]|jgi:glycosyltransferase involved in cell wall biosynthesis|nr:hypothetical protein [Verrucomicrobiota bacterium]